MNRNRQLARRSRITGHSGVSRTVSGKHYVDCSCGWQAFGNFASREEAWWAFVDQHKLGLWLARAKANMPQNGR